NKGECPVGGVWASRNVVWFTTDPEPGGHGLTAEDRLLTKAERTYLSERWGKMLPKAGMFINKQAVRITCIIPSTDRRLVSWKKYARKHLSADDNQKLIRADGSKHKTWYLFFGTVPPEQFRAVEQVIDRCRTRSPPRKWTGTMIKLIHTTDD